MSTPVAPQPAERPPLSPEAKRRRSWWIAGGAAAAAALLFGIGLYRYQWNGGVSQVVTKVLPYPAAIVNGRVIRWSDFQEDLTVLRQFYEDERKRAAPGSAFPSEEEMKTRVLDRMIKDQLAAELADRYGITVTSEDVKKTYEGTILDQAALDTTTGKARAEARAADTLQQLYGLRPAQFQNRILHPFLVRQRLEAAVTQDDALNAEKRKKAEEALAELQAGKAFKDVAIAYSEDPNVATTFGDRGLIGSGLLPKEVEDAAFALKAGETSEVIKSVFGYHVLRVTDRQEKDGKVEKVRLYEILVKPIQLDDYLEAQKKTASIILFVH